MSFRLYKGIFRNSFKLANTHVRGIMVANQVLYSPSEAMETAKARVSTLKNDPGNEGKLKMYALYKQATVGQCNTKKPGMMDFVGQAKWNAWNGLGDISKEAAEAQYISYVNELAGGEEPSAAANEQKNEDEPRSVDGLVITRENGICTITLNRPKKLNAITSEMYEAIRDTLNDAASDDSIKVLCITGEGKYYCSGNDLSNFTKIPPEGPKGLAAKSRDLLKGYVEAYIDFPKPMICAVNGPAIGISVTLLGLADLVYASDEATFSTPFMTLGQSPEGCSSYTFPKLMGYAKANEVLLGGKKLTAQEAFDRNLVTSVIPHTEFHNTIKKKLEYMASLPINSLIYSKALERQREKEMLKKVNLEECIRLEERWLSDDCMNAVMKFLAKNSKM